MNLITCKNSNWATSRENLSSRFATSWDSNRPAQLQRLPSFEILAIANTGIILSGQRTTKALIRLPGFAGWSVPLLFACGINRFSHDVAQFKFFKVLMEHFFAVCGLIILVGTGILGRLFISRKWRVQQGEEPVHRPEACFHTCSSKWIIEHVFHILLVQSW